MSIAVIITDRNTDALCQHLRQVLPEVQIQQWPELPNPEAVKLAVLWKHPVGITQSFSQLKSVLSMGAGMDHIESDDSIGNDLLTGRIVTPALQQNMAQYVLLYILLNHRHHQTYLYQQQQHIWKVLENDVLPTIGFLGLGKLGCYVADQCKALGFATVAWTQTQNHPVHECFHGESGLKQVCERSDFLVVLLPLNSDTKQIINRKILGWCHPGCTLIHVGRGHHVHEQDLLAALNSGEIKQAVLDVFNEEPLPPEHPFWSHPKITITPHSSSRSDVKQTAEQITLYYKNIA